MADVAKAEVIVCSNPGCNQPGTNQCSACKTTVYCGVICQTADWSHHKEECQGHLRKVGKTDLAKAKGFHGDQKWVQALRYGELAATKLKQLKDRRLETVQAIDGALGCKFYALQAMGRNREAMECAEERYTLWAMNHMRNPGSIQAALNLIQSCLHNREYEDAERYARHAYFMIAEMTDNFIPSDERPRFLADVSFWLAQAIHRLAEAGGIPQEGQQKAGEEAIALARKALEMHTQLSGTESAQVAADLGILSDVLGFFVNIDDDEIPRLLEQAIATYRRVQGSSSVNVATGEFNLGAAYDNRARSAKAAHDLDRYVANLQLALPHFREAARIFRVNQNLDKASRALHDIVQIEEEMRLISAAAAAATTKS